MPVTWKIECGLQSAGDWSSQGGKDAGMHGHPWEAYSLNVGPGWGGGCGGDTGHAPGMTQISKNHIAQAGLIWIPSSFLSWNSFHGPLLLPTKGHLETRLLSQHCCFSLIAYLMNLPYLLWDRRLLLNGNTSEAPRGLKKMLWKSSQKVVETLRWPFLLPTSTPFSWVILPLAWFHLHPLEQAC